VLSALRLSPEEFERELRLAAATHWYEHGRISEERAALVGGLSRARFLKELVRTKSDAFVVDFDDLKRELRQGMRNATHLASPPTSLMRRSPSWSRTIASVSSAQYSSNLSRWAA